MNYEFNYRNTWKLVLKLPTNLDQVCTLVICQRTGKADVNDIKWIDEKLRKLYNRAVLLFWFKSSQLCWSLISPSVRTSISIPCKVKMLTWSQSVQKYRHLRKKTHTHTHTHTHIKFLTKWINCRQTSACNTKAKDNRSHWWRVTLGNF